MRLAYAHLGGKPFIAVAHAGQWLNWSLWMRDAPSRFPWLAMCPEPTLVDWLRNTPKSVATLKESLAYLAGTGSVHNYVVRGELRLLAPIPNPSKIVALGRNYAAHAAEYGHAVPEEPIYFAKAPSSIIGPGEAIAFPDYVKRLDPEIELAVVIGRRIRAVPEEQAMGFVAGYTVCNDVTARDMQKLAQGKGYPWFASKSLDTFCPMGPHLVLSDEIPDPHALELTLRVNGEVRQHASTGLMVFKIPHLIAFISHQMTLEPGDVVATGTPEGTAPVQRGDVLECDITRVGTLRNQVL
jgi:5-oxopent-3-ene-1,2,5-tricarboxylate decarboxylase/2-hydroxyhepta-2,4-diene-1,7-dioate isomerase